MFIKYEKEATFRICSASEIVMYLVNYNFLFILKKRIYYTEIKTFSKLLVELVDNNESNKTKYYLTLFHN